MATQRTPSHWNSTGALCYGLKAWKASRKVLPHLLNGALGQNSEPVLEARVSRRGPLVLVAPVAGRVSQKATDGDRIVEKPLRTQTAVGLAPLLAVRWSLLLHLRLAFAVTRDPKGAVCRLGYSSFGSPLSSIWKARSHFCFLSEVVQIPWGCLPITSPHGTPAAQSWSKASASVHPECDSVCSEVWEGGWTSAFGVVAAPIAASRSVEDERWYYAPHTAKARFEDTGNFQHSEKLCQYFQSHNGPSAKVNCLAHRKLFPRRSSLTCFNNRPSKGELPNTSERPKCLE